MSLQYSNDLAIREERFVSNPMLYFPGRKLQTNLKLCLALSMSY